ncbi:DUF1576 domain-containing protein [Turicibacter sanguinis]|uniref:DUF1576 domain-containing protein n=1 Tax=Turicibacter sanguinis TaxID=154288 RepID=UPI00399A642F
METIERQKIKIWKESDKMWVMIFIALSLIGFGFITSSFKDILNGLYEIIIHPDALITDYIVIGGIGGAFVNSGILTLIIIFLLWKNKIHFNGATFASLFLIAGFSFLGKNLLNIWAIIIGVYLFAKYHKQPFARYIYIALFGTAMAPIVTEIIFHFQLILPLRIILGIILGILIGFILPPLASHFLKVHQGYNLYNVGFTAGMMITVLVALFKSFGYNPSSQLIWGEGNNLLIGSYLYFLCTVMILLGELTDTRSIEQFKRITHHSGRLVSDFILIDGFSPTLINLGINGLIATTYVLIVGGQLNGPTIGGIFAVIGFGAFGKHFKNIIPVMIGVVIGSYLKVWSINDPSILLAALFGTSLAPIAGEFGWAYGILAGFLHSSVVLHVGSLHAGLNLYNNGFSAGIVAAILVPLIEAFRKETRQ